VVARGDIILVALSGDYAKPWPALVVQSDATLAMTGSVTFCLMTSDLVEPARLRVTVSPDSANGLKLVSQIQTDKIYTLPASKIRGPIGRVDQTLLGQVSLALALHLDLIAP